jgi:sugar lactone lactonase YvrE
VSARIAAPLTVRVATDTRDRVGESPVWDERKQCLYWVDIEGRQLRCWHAATHAVQSWPLPQRAGCIALTEGPDLVAAMEDGIYRLRLLDQGRVQVQCLATAQHPQAGMRFNDGRCDPAGRLWVGSMVMDMSLACAQGGLYCLDEHGLRGPLVSGLITPNGSAFSPDGRRFYLSDSHASVQRIWTFDIDLRHGRLDNRRLWVDMQALPGRPDGAAVDREGHYWICANDAAKVHRFTPDGQLHSSLDLPVPKPAMCAFGGADLRTLFITSIQPAGVDEAAPGLHGALFAVDLPTGGLPEPRFTRFPGYLPE